MDDKELAAQRATRNRKDWGIAGKDGRVKIITALRVEPGLFEKVHDISDADGRLVGRMLGDWIKEGVERWEAAQVAKLESSDFSE